MKDQLKARIDIKINEYFNVKNPETKIFITHQIYKLLQEVVRLEQSEKIDH